MLALATIACGETTSAPAATVPVAKYAEEACRDAADCCHSTWSVYDPSKCRAYAEGWIPADDDERARTCVRLLKERSDACDKCLAQSAEDTLAETCLGTVYWGYSDTDGYRIGTGVLGPGSGSKKIGEPCEYSLECQAPEQGFVRCIRWKEVAADGITLQHSGSFCQQVMPMDPTGQQCLVFGWKPVGPASLGELAASIEAGTATSVTECGLPGSHTECLNILPNPPVQKPLPPDTEHGTCVVRPGPGESCSLDINHIACDDGTECDPATKVCVAAPNAPCGVVMNPLWGYGMCGVGPN